MTLACSRCFSTIRERWEYCPNCRADLDTSVTDHLGTFIEQKPSKGRWCPNCKCNRIMLTVPMTGKKLIPNWCWLCGTGLVKDSS